MKAKFTLMLLLATLLMTSCNKELSKSYTLINNTGMDGTVFVHECNDANETINIQSETIVDGSSKSFVAAHGTIKVKLFIKDLNKWVQQVFYLNEESTSITIDGETVIGNKEP